MNTSSYALDSSRSLSLVLALVMLGVCAVAAPLRQVASEAGTAASTHAVDTAGQAANTATSVYGDVAQHSGPGTGVILPYGAMRHDANTGSIRVAPYGAYTHAAATPASAIAPYGAFRGPLAP